MYLISVILGLAMQASPAIPSGAVKGEISVKTGHDQLASSTSTVEARCDGLELRIATETKGGSSTANRFSVPTIALNGRMLPIQGTALSEALGRGPGLKKYVAFCGRPKNAIFVRYYSISKPNGIITFSVGSFTVSRDGGTIFHGEEQVPSEDFWFG